MKVCFVQEKSTVYFGVMAIAGYIGKAGHEFSVLIDSEEKNTIEKIKEKKPDLIGVSVISSEHKWLIRICREIKSSLPDVPIIIGGIHAILYPDILAETEADLLCRCEGETVMEKILAILSKENNLELLHDIPGLVYRKGEGNRNELVYNPMPPLLTDLDFEEDGSIYYDRYPRLANDDMKTFLSMRGCPYNCYFCYNSIIKKAFKNQGKYLRRKKPDLFVAEIKRVVDKYNTRFISIIDDLFTFDKDWLSEFAILYKQQIGIPYLCQIRADRIDEETVAILADSGCYTACMGVETGNEELRYNTLNKKISNEQMSNAAAMLKKHKINLKTSDMFGIPGETADQAFETIEFNIKIGTDFLGSAMLMPFPGTGVEKIALEKGWLEKPLDCKNLPGSAYNESVFKAPQIPILTNIMNVAQLCIFFPQLLPFMRRFVHLRCRWLFQSIHFFTMTVRFIRERRLGIVYGMAYLWRFRKNV